ncbi:MAG: hypothetical protein RLZZ40_773 [Actinomycetota bacterium]
MSQIVVSSVVAVSALGGFLLGILNLWRSRSTTTVEYRVELSESLADIPFLLDMRDVEQSFRDGVEYVLGFIDPTYSRQIQFRLVVRLSRRGVTPAAVEFVEIVEPRRRRSFVRQPGQVGVAVKTIDANSHHEWTFNVLDFLRTLVGECPKLDFPDLAIHISYGGRDGSRLKKMTRIGASELRKLVIAAREVWPTFPEAT